MGGRRPATRNFTRSLALGGGPTGRSRTPAGNRGVVACSSRHAGAGRASRPIAAFEPTKQRGATLLQGNCISPPPPPPASAVISRAREQKWQRRQPIPLRLLPLRPIWTRRRCGGAGNAPRTPSTRELSPSRRPSWRAGGRGRARRKWARMRSSPATAADPRGRAATNAQRDHHSQHPRRLPAPAPSAPTVPLCRLSVAELGRTWRQRGSPRGVLFPARRSTVGGLAGAALLSDPSTSSAAPRGCPSPRHPGGLPLGSTTCGFPSRPSPTAAGFRAF